MCVSDRDLNILLDSRSYSVRVTIGKREAGVSCKWHRDCGQTAIPRQYRSVGYFSSLANAPHSTCHGEPRICLASTALARHRCVRVQAHIGIEGRGSGMLKWCLATALVFGASVAVIAQSLSKAPVIATEANWKVLQIKGAMTDKVSCVAIYKDNHDIQLSPGTLYISYKGRGGVASYSIRIDQ